MNEPRTRRLGPGAIVLIVLTLVVLAMLATRRSRTLGLHQTLQLDDFFFTVQDAARLPVDPARAKTAQPSPGLVD
jgi:hypothetical protein